MAKKQIEEVSQELNSNEIKMQNKNGDILIASNKIQASAFEKFGFKIVVESANE